MLCNVICCQKAFDLLQLNMQPVQNKSFQNLTTAENIEKMEIDPRLEASFKRVMGVIQSYFNANGYSQIKDYDKLFHDYLLSDDFKNEKLRIYLNKEPSKIGAAGFYRQKSGDYNITIDEQCLANDENLDSTLAHEFIHFIVMHKAKGDAEIVGGGFTNEALTEMLTQQMYPKSNAYKPQTSMFTFANALIGRANDYKSFLQAHSQIGGGYSQNDYNRHAGAYHERFKNEGYRMETAVNDPDYIAAQRKLIELIRLDTITDVDTYLEKVRILKDRPVQDQEFMNDYEKTLDNAFMENLGIKDTGVQEQLKGKLQQLRDVEAALYKYGDAEVYEFIIGGKTVAVDKNMGIQSPKFGGYTQSSTDPQKRIMEFRNRNTNEVVTVDMNKIDFSKRRADLLKQKQSILPYFSKTAGKDLLAVASLASSESTLRRLDKYTLPNISWERTPQVVYVAQYDNAVEVLNRLRPIGTTGNRQQSKYIGVTSKTNGLICSDPIKKVDEAIVFSATPESTINHSIKKILEPSIVAQSKEKMAEYIAAFKQSPLYDDDIEEPELQKYAVEYAVDRAFDALDFEQKKKHVEQVTANRPQFALSSNNGQIEVSLIHGQDTMYKAERETLVDTEGGLGLYNNYFQQKSKSVTTPPRDMKNTVIQRDNQGDITVPQKQKPNYEQHGDYSPKELEQAKS